MNSAMEDLRRSLSRTFNLERTGGLILIRDDSTLMLVNYDLVHLQLIDAVKTQHPDVEVYFEKFAHSSSGYVVFFLFKPRRALFASSEFFQFVLLSLLGISFYGLISGAVPFDGT